jgi:aspartyl-tRNA(Asn)/glutamyl-tRNA(Gln) amidotransferase subunit B
VTPSGLVELLSLVSKNTINTSTAKDVLADMFATGKTAQEIVNEKGLAQISDETQLKTIIDEVLKANPGQVTAYLAGKDKLQGWFVGQVMRASQGKANPGLVNRLLAQELARLKQ